MAVKHLDIARMTIAAGGTGTLTLGNAVHSFVSFAGAGALSGDQIVYAIEDGAFREIGVGTYMVASGVVTFRRDTIYMSTNGGAPINVSSNAQIFSTVAAEDLTDFSAALAPRVVQYATNSGNRVYTAAGTVTLAHDPSPGNLLVLFASGRQPDAIRAPFTELGNQGTAFNTARVGCMVVPTGDVSKSVTVDNYGDWIDVALLEITNWEGYVAEVGLPSNSNDTLTAGSALSTSTASITIAMIEFDNRLDLSSSNSDYTTLTYYGPHDTGNHNAALLVSGPYSVSQTAPAITLSGTPNYPVYARITLHGKTIKNVLAGLSDVNMTPPPAQNSVLAYDNTLGAWHPVSIDQLKAALGIGSDGNDGGGTHNYIRVKAVTTAAPAIIDRFDIPVFTDSNNIVYTPISASPVAAVDGSYTYVCTMADVFAPIKLTVTGLTTHLPSGYILAPGSYLGALITVETSSDGVSWTYVGAVTYAMPPYATTPQTIA